MYCAIAKTECKEDGLETEKEHCVIVSGISGVSYCFAFWALVRSSSADTHQPRHSYILILIPMDVKFKDGCGK